MIMDAAFSSKAWSLPLRQQDVMIQKANVFLHPHLKTPNFTLKD